MSGNTNQPRCAALRRDGQPCRAPALPGDALCWAHSERMAAERDAARRRGGQNRAALVRLRKAVPGRMAPVLDRLEAALQEVRDGDITPQQAASMAAVSRAMVAVLQAGELEQRLRALEESAALKDGQLAWRA